MAAGERAAGDSSGGVPGQYCCRDAEGALEDIGLGDYITATGHPGTGYPRMDLLTVRGAP